MPEHKILITKIRQWIAVNSDSKSDSQASSLTPESLRILATTYCDLVGPLSSQLSRCAQWATKGLFVEACSVCDDYPDLLGLAKEFTFEGSLRVVGNTSASAEVAKLLQPFAPTGVIVPVIADSDIAAVERAYGELDRTAEMVAEVQSLALARASVALRVTALRKLFRDNPGASIWQNEIRRIEGGAFEFVHERMKIAHQQGDFALAQEVMNELGRKDWGMPVPVGVKNSCEKMWNELLGREAERRYGEIARSIREASSAANAERLEELEAAWLQVQNETGCDPSSDSDASVESAFQWLAADRERRRREAEFHDAVAAVEAAIENGEDDQEIARCFSHASSFEREVPERVRIRIENMQEAGRLNHRRKTRMIAAAITSVVILIGAFAAWAVHRGHVRDSVAILVKQVEDQLSHHQIPAAEQVLASQPDLAGEVEVAAVSVKVTEAKPQWEKDRKSFDAWKEEIGKASTGDISKAKLDAMLAAVAVLKPSMTDDEVKQCDQLVSKAKSVLDGTVAKRLISLTPKSNVFGVESTGILNLDQIAESSRYDTKALTAIRDKVSFVIAKGDGLLAEYSDIGAEHLTSIKTGIDRLKKLQAELVDRIAKIGEFEKTLAQLTASYKDSDEFNRKYAAIVEDSKAVLAGLGLGSDFKSGRELALGFGGFLTWNALIDGRPERFFAWKGKLPSEPAALAALKDYVTANPDSTFRPQVQKLILIAEKAFDDRDQSAATRIAGRITGSGMADICAVPLKKGSPVYRKRADAVNLATADPWTDGVMRSIADMLTDWEKLEPLIKSQSKGYDRVPNDAGDCPTSKKIRELLSVMVKDGTLIGTRKLMIQLITQIAAGDNAASSKREDSLLRLWCVLNLVDFWMEELAFDKGIGIDQKLFDSAAQVREKFSQAVDYDWVVTRLEKNDLEERARLINRASEALKIFAAISASNKEISDTTIFGGLEDSLVEVKVAGVVEVNPFLRSRSLQVIDPDSATPLLMLVQSKLNKFEFVSFQPSTIEQTLATYKSPYAPLLVFSQQSKKGH
ncbi:MAG: hypothetical protein DWH77_00820 [Planctomycetota bacterium]|nr:MAG: hypothetical protein DWH77_00820 [Planctomycetota bacterium]